MGDQAVNYVDMYADGSEDALFEEKDKLNYLF